MAGVGGSGEGSWPLWVDAALGQLSYAHATITDVEPVDEHATLLICSRGGSQRGEDERRLAGRSAGEWQARRPGDGDGGTGGGQVAVDAAGGDGWPDELIDDRRVLREWYAAFSFASIKGDSSEHYVAEVFRNEWLGDKVFHLLQNVRRWPTEVVDGALSVRRGDSGDAQGYGE